MITKIRHTGIYVDNKNFIETKYFYVMLGLTIIYDKQEDWGTDQGIVNIIKLEAKNGGILELVGMDKHIKYSGCHMAIEINDMDLIYDKLIKNDISFLIKPRHSPDKSAMVAFCYDPNGFILELVEIL